MSLNWSRRLSEWRTVVRDYGRGHYAGMILAILSGPVPANVWRARMGRKGCGGCPVHGRKLVRDERGILKWIGRHICRIEIAGGRVLGCSCATHMLALTAAPYPGGCWAANVAPGEGWPAYRFPNVRAKLRAVWRFLFPKKEPVVVLRTFWDFSATKHAPIEWRLRGLWDSDVRVYWDASAYESKGAWCREVKNVRCAVREHTYDRAYVPLPGQIVTYQQWENK